jgi:hypothetical protein
LVVVIVVVVVEHVVSNDCMTCELVKFVISCAGLLVTLLLWRQSI